ncbi:MAG: hypothetical protein ACRDQ5_09720 [Sciscionella sp.]
MDSVPGCGQLPTQEAFEVALDEDLVEDLVEDVLEDVLEDVVDEEEPLPESLLPLEPDSPLLDELSDLLDPESLEDPVSLEDPESPEDFAPSPFVRLSVR